MNSLFVTGTDTDVGKTYVTAGLAASIRKKGVDVGIMKPFAAGSVQKKGFKSNDVEVLSKAAKVNDEECLVNPQFFPIPASPYTAWKNLKIKPNVKTVLSSFKRLQELHEMLLVEGMGGLMTPILKDYFIADLVKEMKIPSVIVARSRVGTVNHTVMTCRMCRAFRIPVKGIIINHYGGGYPPKELTRDLQELTGIQVLGSIPFLKNLSDAYLHRIFERNINLEKLLNDS